MTIFRGTLFVFCVSVLTISCTGIFSHPHQAELQFAFERSEALSTEAQITLDTSRLSEGFTQKGITAIEEVLQYDTRTTFVSVETKVDWIEVIEI